MIMFLISPMKEFYVKVADEKEEFFIQLLNDLDYEYEKLFSSNDQEGDLDDQHYFTDADE